MKNNRCLFILIGIGICTTVGSLEADVVHSFQGSVVSVDSLILRTRRSVTRGTKRDGRGD